MNNSLRLLSIGCLGLFLAGCATLAKLQMKTVTLADGRKAKVGLVRPTDNWGCKELGNEAYNWALIKMKSLGMGHAMLKKKAVQYANQHRIKANYIYLQIPETIAVGGIDVTAMSKAYTYYYRCKRINPDNKLGVQKRYSIN